MEFCFVHAADLHLGGRRWVRSASVEDPIADRVAWADRLALHALVDLCLEERAKFLLCAGDVVDGWCRDHTVGLALVQELLRLRASDCEVVLLLGNHDVRNRVMKPLLLPQNARLFGVHGPETRVFNQLGVALHGWSFPKPDNPEDIASLYPVPLAGLLNIGMLHTSAEGRRGHVNYAPCSRRTLRQHGYDYWALGHVHAREVVSTDPWVVFPGNLQGRGLRESGSKGATLVRVSAGRIVGVEHRSLDALRFATVVAQTQDSERFDDVLSAVHGSLARARREAEGRPLVVRLVLQGAAGAACTLSVPGRTRESALRAVARELCGNSLWIEEAWIEAEIGSWLLSAA